jgi:hypothetical protein
VPTTQDDPRKCIKRLRARFERWELTHLRELAASLHERLAEAERRADIAESDARWSERRADIAEQLNEALQDDLRSHGEPNGPRIGLTQQGELILLPKGGVA